MTVEVIVRRWESLVQQLLATGKDRSGPLSLCLRIDRIDVHRYGKP
jgi:hypothetical protein